jgi:Protein of unknown function (DUF3887)
MQPLQFLKDRRWISSLILPIALIVTPAFAQPSKPAASPPSQVASPVKSQLTAVAEQFIDLVAAGQFEQAHQLLNPTLREGWTRAQMQSDWLSLQRITGSYAGRTETQVVDDSLVLITLKFQNVNDDLLIIFDQHQQIRGVDFPLQILRQ